MVTPDENAVVASPEVMGGVPVVRGTRVPVYVILEELAAGRTIEEIQRSYPSLTVEGIQAAIRYAADRCAA